MPNTKIEWCDKTWSPVTGCSPISEGCAHCWAKRMANRLRGRYGYPQDDPFKVTFHPDRLDEPLHWKEPSRIFVSSMGDLFHEDVEGEWLRDIFSVIRGLSNHTFLILTKRPQNINKRYFEYFGLTAYSHVWLGVSVENQRTADERIPILLQIPAAKRFISCEPLLEEIRLRRGIYQMGPPEDRREYGTSLNYGIHWIIAGGETGPKARPMHPDWVRSLRDQCQAAGVPFFFKQWGEWAWSESPEMKKYKRFEQFKLHRFEDGIYMYKIGRKKAGHFLDGKEWREFPK